MRVGTHTQKNSLTVGKSAGTERTFRGSKENAADGLWKAGQSKNCTHSLHSSSVHSSLSHESPIAKGGWVLESGFWSTDPGRGQLLAVKRQPEWIGIRSSTMGKVCGKSPGHCKGNASFLSGAQGSEPSLQHLYPPTSFLGLLRHWEELPFEQARPPLRPGSPPSLG